MKQYLTAFSDVQSFTLTSNQSHGRHFRSWVYLSLFLTFSFRQSRIKMSVKCFRMSEPQCVNDIVASSSTSSSLSITIIIIISSSSSLSFNHYIRMSFSASSLASAYFQQHWNGAPENVHMANRADILMDDRCQSRHVIPMVIGWRVVNIDLDISCVCFFNLHILVLCTKY